MPKVKAKPSLPVLSQTGLQDLKNKIQADEALLAEANGKVPEDHLIPDAHLGVNQAGISGLGVDASDVQARIRRNKQALAAYDPAQRKLTGAERQKAEKRYSELEEILPKTMLTREEQDLFPSTGDSVKDQAYRQAVEKRCAKGGESDPSWIKLAEEFKQLGRILWPEDPTKSNLETIRPSGGISGRHFRK